MVPINVFERYNNVSEIISESTGIQLYPVRQEADPNILWKRLGR